MDQPTSPILGADPATERARTEPPEASFDEMKARAAAALGGRARRFFRAFQDWPADEPETMGPETYRRAGPR